MSRKDTSKQLLFYLLQYMLLCAKFYHLLSILLLLHFLLNKYSKQFHVNVLLQFEMF